MRFGDIPLEEAEGCVLAHSLLVGGRKWPKGRILSPADIYELRAEGHETIIGARLDPGDVSEDTAAARIAAAVAGPNVRAHGAATGRVNLHATAAGLFLADRGAVDRLNGVAESVTLATLPEYEPVEAGKIVATVKIIPFAVPEDTLALCQMVAGRDAVRVAPWKPLRAGLVQTRVAGTKETVLDKTATTTTARMAACGGALVEERRCGHTVAAVADAMQDLRIAGCDLFLLIGASAITDRADVLPSALDQVGGTVEHLGMPVDPGNLLMLGRWGEAPVLGLPGCARSPKLNGADWVLRRLAAGVPVGPRDIMGMGVGGLVTDVPERPLPRARAERRPAEE